MPSCAASLAAAPVPAAVPLDGLLAGEEAPDDVPPEVVPPVVVPPDVVPPVVAPPEVEPEDVPVVDPVVGDEAPLAPLLVDPVEVAGLPPPQAASAAARTRPRGRRKAAWRDSSRSRGRVALSDKGAPGCRWKVTQASAKRRHSHDREMTRQLQHAGLTGCYAPAGARVASAPCRLAMTPARHWQCMQKLARAAEPRITNWPAASSVANALAKPVHG